MMQLSSWYFVSRSLCSTSTPPYFCSSAAFYSYGTSTSTTMRTTRVCRKRATAVRGMYAYTLRRTGGSTSRA
eukprot:scaffold13003_cov43-Prasinocladus_malaysianus.AAC.1